MVSVRRAWMRSLLLGFWIAGIIAGWCALRAPRAADATPAYARRYNVECQTCHSPNPPRLNNVGMVFRRAGFRMPDSNDQGQYTLKNVPARGIGDAFALAGQIDGTIVQAPDSGQSVSSFQLGEVELIAGTSIADHYSAQLMFVPFNDAGESELEDAEVQANYGTPAGQITVRGGKIQPLFWQKGGHGSLTLSAPLMLDEMSPAMIGSFAGPAVGMMLDGLEVGYMATRLEKGHMLAGIVSVAALNGFDVEGGAARTHPGDGVDLLAQGTALIGSRNTANVYYYNGSTTFEGATGTARDEFNRLGLTGSYAPIDRVDLVAGFGSGQDKTTELGLTVKNRGFYGEVTGEIFPRWTATYRYDEMDPDTDTGGDLIKDHVFGTTYLLHDTVFLSAEYREITMGSDKSHDIVGRIRLIY